MATRLNRFAKNTRDVFGIQMGGAIGWVFPRGETVGGFIRELVFGLCVPRDRSVASRSCRPWRGAGREHSRHRCRTRRAELSRPQTVKMFYSLRSTSGGGICGRMADTTKGMEKAAAVANHGMGPVGRQLKGKRRRRRS